MKNRRYFTCPVQAIYMAKEFGVKFKSFDYYALINQIEQNKSAKCQYYITPESEAIFEPKERDGILAYGDTFFSISTEVAERGIFRHGVISLDRVQMIDNPQITVRDDKHFFMGELENETQN